MKPAVAELSGFQASSASAFSVAARAGGAVICLGYLLGLVPGSVVAVVGGLALLTFGRNLLLEHHEAALSGAALALLAASLGIAALRWGALDLAELRGVQSVLGPTVMVGPVTAALATSLAAAASLIGLAVWMARPWPDTGVLFGWWGLEAAIGALAVVTAFFEPVALMGSNGEGVAGAAGWVGTTALLTAVAGGGGWLFRKLPGTLQVVVVVVAGAALAAGAALLVTVL